MKYLFLFLFTITAWADSTLKLLFPKGSIDQGEIVEVQVRADSQAASLELQKLKGATLEETLYFLEISPLMRMEGKSDYEAAAKVIFVKVPNANELMTKLGATPLTLSWGEVTVNPTEPPEGFLLGNFEIPRPGRLFIWLASVVCLGLSAFVAYRVWAPKARAKREKKRRRLKLKSELLSASQFSDLVHLWQKKRHLYEEFPQVESAFVEFERVLNKHQFKPSQSDREKSEVMDAYQNFRSKIEGSLNGV